MQGGRPVPRLYVHEVTHPVRTRFHPVLLVVSVVHLFEGFKGDFGVFLGVLRVGFVFLRVFWGFSQCFFVFVGVF